MGQCLCGRPITYIRSGNTFYHGYCSRYCSVYYQNPDAYPMEKMSDAITHKNHLKRAKIPVDCFLCGEKFLLRYGNPNMNFCGKKCHHIMMQGKRNWRDLYVLTNIKLAKSPVTSRELAEIICPTLGTNYLTGRHIGSILRVYLSRGIIEIDEEAWPRTYKMVSEANKLPVGKIVKEKLRLKEVKVNAVS